MERLLELPGQLLEPGWVDAAGPAGRAARQTLPTVSSVNRIQADSSLLAWSLSVSSTTLESTRMVFSVPGVLRKPAMFAGGMPAGGRSWASHS